MNDKGEAPLFCYTGYFYTGYSHGGEHPAAKSDIYVCMYVCIINDGHDIRFF